MSQLEYGPNQKIAVHVPLRPKSPVPFATNYPMTLYSCPVKSSFESCSSGISSCWPQIDTRKASHFDIERNVNSLIWLCCNKHLPDNHPACSLPDPPSSNHGLSQPGDDRCVEVWNLAKQSRNMPRIGNWSAQVLTSVRFRVLLTPITAFSHERQTRYNESASNTLATLPAFEGSQASRAD